MKTWMISMMVNLVSSFLLQLHCHRPLAQISCLLQAVLLVQVPTHRQALAPASVHQFQWVAPPALLAQSPVRSRLSVTGP